MGIETLLFKNFQEMHILSFSFNKPFAIFTKSESLGSLTAQNFGMPSLSIILFIFLSKVRALCPLFFEIAM